MNYTLNSEWSALLWKLNDMLYCSLLLVLLLFLFIGFFCFFLMERQRQCVSFTTSSRAKFARFNSLLLITVLYPVNNPGCGLQIFRNNPEMFFEYGKSAIFLCFLEFTFFFFPVIVWWRPLQIGFGSVSKMTCSSWDEPKEKSDKRSWKYALLWKNNTLLVLVWA